MSNLVFQNYNNRCNGWTNPSDLFFGPHIDFLSGYQSPAGSSTVVSINGTNFFSYSTIRFGTFSPTVYFVNSNILQFYVPATLSSGTFPVQVFNGSGPSNSVNYTIDNASGYWLLNGNGSISNTNNGPISVSFLSRGAPFTIITTTYDFTDTTLNTNANSISWIICDTATFGGEITITLPISVNGRELMLKNIGTHAVRSIDSSGAYIANINPLSGPSTDIILSGTAGKWATIVYDQTQNKWITMQAN
jgi:hypothetical protein